jgi:hypothetical protein
VETPPKSILYSHNKQNLPNQLSRNGNGKVSCSKFSAKKQIASSSSGTRFLQSKFVLILNLMLGKIKHKNLRRHRKIKPKLQGW